MSMKDEERAQVSIDLEALADSLMSGKFKTLHPLSEECSIFRVPQRKRCLHQDHYTPQMVSIGPFHRGKSELKAMEEHKMRYLHCFLQRTKVSTARFLAFIKEKEEKLRNCYAEPIELSSNELVALTFVDAVFVIELFLRRYEPDLITEDDRICGKPWLYSQMWSDLWLLENQLPLFILNDLFNLAKTETYNGHYERLSLITITYEIWKPVWQNFQIQKNLLEVNFSAAEHFLDLIRLCFHPSQSRAQSQFEAQNIAGAKALHQAGVKFIVGSSNNLPDFKFNHGVLEISFLMIYDETEVLFRNLLAFESMHTKVTRFVNDYVIMMCRLVNTPKDAELLIQNGVVGSATEEGLSTMFNSLEYDCVVDSNFGYSDLVEELQSYCKSPLHKWKATLKQNYFNTPWASISVIAAVVLLLLTVTQTVCSIIAL